MSTRWITLTSDHLIAAKHAALIAAAQTSGVGVDDPLADSLADTTARIRAAISTGNSLDTDTTKIPRSLKGLALRIAVRALKARLEYPLSEDERQQAREDASFLNRITDERIRFEAPDDDAGQGEMQAQPSPSICTPVRVFDPCASDGI